MLLIVPIYHLSTGARIEDSILLLVLLSLAVMTVAPIHNTIFDWVEARQTGRLASERPTKWRVIHAVSHEFWAICATLPIIMWLEDYSFLEALVVDILLTLAYMVYAYFYYWLYDKVRPMRRAADQ